MKETDVLIIGGGPAGLATGLYLLRHDPGWAERCMVLERERHPRHKLCAGGITPFGLQRLKDLDLKLDVPFVPVRSAVFRYGDRSVPVLGKPAFVVTRRAEFDAWLAHTARDRGLDLREGLPVEELTQTDAGVLVRTPDGPIHAKAVVGADGSLGVVRRWLAGRERPSRVARLLEVVTPAGGHEPEYSQSFARFDFTPAEHGLQGYYWDFPSLINSRPFMNRGIYDSRVEPARNRAPLPALLETWLDRSGVEADAVEVEGHPIHWFSPGNRFSGRRTLLVGDAAGADPLLGEGIGVALGYAEVAAKALHRGLAAGDVAFRGYRRQILASPVGRYLMLRWLVAKASYRLGGHATYMRLLWRAAGVMARVYRLPSVPGVLPTQ